MDKVEIQSAETPAQAPEEEQPVEATEESRIEGLPEKFKSVEDLAKSYAELEKKLGETSEAKPKEESLEVPSDKEVEAAEKAVERAGLDMGALEQEYSEKGELSEETLKRFEEVGIGRQYVNDYIEGQRALYMAQVSEVHTLVGGQDNYTDMVNWAAENLTEGEQSTYNEAMNSRDLERIKFAVEGLSAKYQKAEGTSPNLINGKSSAPVGPGFESWAQVTAAMNDPRYTADPAYRAEVQSKLENSNI
tara:strand:+ start:499 stop:1242 length:744 start_codon:yes stop_codon:yes gene_type:complete